MNTIAAKVTSSGILDSRLTASAAEAKLIQSAMRLGTIHLDVDFALPPRVSMKFLSIKANERQEAIRETDEWEIACKWPDPQKTRCSDRVMSAKRGLCACESLHA